MFLNLLRPAMFFNLLAPAMLLSLRQFQIPAKDCCEDLQQLLPATSNLSQAPVLLSLALAVGLIAYLLRMRSRMSS